jgi:alpha-aminoadipic semialdehyde synthase
MIGIRREDKNEWERRAALTPDHVSELVQRHDVELRVQPSDRRAFTDLDYTHAGATLDEDLSGCRVVLGIKEIPAEKLHRDTVYLYFSHTSKGQDYNMPMLRRLLDLGCTLIDYESIVDERNKRLIFFGKHAGYAGMIDTLWALGRRLKHEGHVTPLEDLRLAHDYSSLDEATHHISRIGERLRHTGFPGTLHTVVCGFTGSGNASTGAQEILDRLPTLEVAPEQLDDLMADPDRPRKVIYKVLFKRRHRFAHRDGDDFDATELAEHPERFTNGLVRWFPQLTMLVHGAFWRPEQPRVIGLDDLDQLWSGGRPMLRVIADISCDIGGGIEATVRPTTPGDPVFVYDLDRRKDVSGWAGRGPVILAIDNLPCQLAAESSEHFGDTLVRWIPTLDRCPWTKPLDELELPECIRRSVIVHRGELTPTFRYLDRFLSA